MEYRRINPHPSLSISPSHTHPYTNSILLESWSISRDGTTRLGPLCVHRDAPTIPLGSLCVHRDVPAQCGGLHTNPQSRCPPQPFSPILGSMFLYFISYKRQHDPACVLARCGVQSSGILVALWSTCVVLFCYVSSPVAFDWLPLRVSMCASAFRARRDGPN